MTFEGLSLYHIPTLIEERGALLFDRRVFFLLAQKPFPRSSCSDRSENAESKSELAFLIPPLFLPGTHFCGPFRFTK